MAHRAFKDRIYAQFARVGNALASPRRLELLDLLAQAPRHVDALAAETDMSVASVSQHLQVLRNARLVEADRQGTKVVYRLAKEEVLRLWLSLRAVAESRLPEVGLAAREFGVHAGAGPTLARDELQRLVEQGAVMILDVRPALEFQHGHLPGAVSVPVAELLARLAELPRDRQIALYCRGAYCLFADEALAVLHQHGFQAYRLEGGWQEWLGEGRPTAAAPAAPAPAPGNS